MKKIAITGNIGTGKSSLVALFAKDHFPIFNADACVAQLYQTDICLQKELHALCPHYAAKKWITKQVMAEYVQKNPALLAPLEAIILKYISRHQNDFIATHAHQAWGVFEVPLLFENHLQAFYDKIILLHAQKQARWERVKDRPHMTEQKFNLFVTRQVAYRQVMLDADYVIDSSGSWQDVERIYSNIMRELHF